MEVFEQTKPPNYHETNIDICRSCTWYQTTPEVDNPSKEICVLHNCRISFDGVCDNFERQDVN